MWFPEHVRITITLQWNAEQFAKLIRLFASDSAAAAKVAEELKGSEHALRNAVDSVEPH